MGLWMPIYKGLVSPAELTLLCRSIAETKHIAGPVVEIGCAAGATTIFLNKFMDDIGIDKPYWCIDTFGGFTEEDIDFETQNRGKDRSRLQGGFAANSQQWFEKTMSVNGISRVRTVKADINTFELPQELNNVSVCFIDVDLYRPVRSALSKIFSRMAPGGIVLVHDCVFGNVHDGAAQAYNEFSQQTGLPVDIQCRIGRIYVPAAATSSLPD